MKPLEQYEVGEFGELSARPNPRELIVFPVPSIDEILRIHQERVGRQLTETEIADARWSLAGGVCRLESVGPVRIRNQIRISPQNRNGSKISLGAVGPALLTPVL